MRVVCHKRVPIKHLTFSDPDRFQALSTGDDPFVAELAASQDAIGTIHEPIVRQEDMLVVAGENRIAAHVKRGKDFVTVTLVQCTDDEVGIVRRAENAHRRHNPERRRELMDELVVLMSKEIEKVKPGIPNAGSGRRATAVGEARRKLAAERGVRPESIRQQEYRTKERKEAERLGMSVPDYRNAKKTGHMPPTSMLEEPALPPVKTLGMNLAPHFAAAMKELQQNVDHAAGKINHALSILTQMEGDGPDLIRSDKMRRAREFLQSAGSLVRMMRPWSLCPACAGIEQVTKECGTCIQSAYVTKDEEALVPAELTTASENETKLVLYRGSYVPASQFFEAIETPAVKGEGDDLFGGLE